MKVSELVCFLRFATGYDLFSIGERKSRMKRRLCLQFSPKKLQQSSLIRRTSWTNESMLAAMEAVKISLPLNTQPLKMVYYGSPYRRDT